MAFILTRRLLSKNIIKVNEVSHLPACSCINISLFKLNNEKVSHFNKSEQIKATLRLPKECYSLNYYSTDTNKDEKEKKLSIFQKFKMMYRDYWYVLVPVHLVTSIAWFGGFYFLAKSGIDICAILQSWHVSEKLINPLKDSSMGYVAISYALYKIATPARYTVTLGGTTISINYLKKWGYIKPVPSKERIKEIYEEKKVTLSKSMKETKEGIIETKDNIIETVRGTKEGIMEKKDSIIESLDGTKKPINEKKSDDVENIKKTKGNLKKLEIDSKEEIPIKGKKKL